MVIMDYTELYVFLKIYTGEIYNDLTPNLSLSNDLGIYGDDASELIISFSEKFNVDISHFKFDEYFEGEGDVISKFVVKLFNGKKTKKDLGIDDLKAAILSGKLK